MLFNKTKETHGEKVINDFIKRLQKCNLEAEYPKKYLVNLKKDENILVILKNISIFEQKFVRKTMTSYRGLVIPQDSFIESSDEKSKRDEGIFILTNQRMIFKGIKKTEIIDL